MIRVTDLHKHFGGVHAVDGASIEIKTGTITGLIGPNGAGKTTLFNVIAGAFPPTSGKVELDGEDITGLPAHELFHKGLLRTFQIAHEFSTLTVRDNLMMVPPGPAWRIPPRRLVQTVSRNPPARKGNRDAPMTCSSSWPVTSYR
jgi:branched-chain amino acid transport system ATP-binding protein